MNSYALVIPVINENGRLTKQLEALKRVKRDVDIIIADGGSTDNSTNPEQLAVYGVTAILTKIGPGKLSAQLRMAIDYCMETGYHGIITMDGNGKDGVEGIVSILSALQGGFDFVQGSRFIQGGQAINTPLERLLAIKLIHSPITSIAARFKYTDSTNGFRGHSKRLLTSTEINPLRDIFDTYELLAYLPIRAARTGYNISEVPVTREYPVGQPTPTKIHGVRAHSHMVKILLKASFGRYNPRGKKPSTSVT